MARNSLPVATSHSRAVLSSEAVTIVFPSGENTALTTMPVCPVKVRKTLPVVMSQSNADLSSDAVMTVFPFGENAALRTVRV
jgi:hypothetical protein